VRYFTRGWASGELSDAEYESASASYWTRVAEITPRLPRDMARMLRTIRLHDAIIEQAIWSSGRKLLQLSLVAVNARKQCVAVQLMYRGAMLGNGRIAALRRAALSRETELLYDEVDVDDEGVLSHRLLFAPCEEVSIEFRQFEMKVSRRPDLRVRLRPAFIEQ
jgi:hypothetical protein